MNLRRSLALVLIVGSVMLTGGVAVAEVASTPPGDQPAPRWPAPGSSAPSPFGPGDPASPPTQPPAGLIPGTPAESPPPTPEAPGEGTSSLLRGPDLRKGQAPTL